MPRKHNFGFSLEKLDLSSVIICVCMVALLILTVLILVKVDKSKQHYCPRIDADSADDWTSCQPNNSSSDCQMNCDGCYTKIDAGLNIQLTNPNGQGVWTWLPYTGMPLPSKNPINLGPMNDINKASALKAYQTPFSTYTIVSFNGTPVSNGDTVVINTGDLISNGNTTFTLGSYNISLLGGLGSSDPSQLQVNGMSGSYTRSDTGDYTLKWPNNTMTLTQSLCK